MRSRPRVPAAAVVVVVLASVAPLVVTTVRPSAVGAQSGCVDPFTDDLRDEVAARFPGQRVTAAVHDTRTGCWSHLHRGMAIQTASVIKAQFLAGVLLRAQDRGRAPTAWEQARIEPMMRLSHNPPSSELFLDLGGVPGQEALDRRFGLTATTSTNRWGATTSTAEDRTRLVLALLHDGGPLGPEARERAWRTMAAVHPTQQWGISAGVPAGWSVALKNGFYPTSGAPAWRIGSTGFVREDATGQGYGITVQSDQNPDHATGQALVELVSAHVAAALTDGEAASRPVDRAVCVAALAGESWAGVARRVGSGDAAAVRSVAGGPEAPLAHMRVCRPELAPDDGSGPTARYVAALHQTFLGRGASPSERTRATVDLTEGLRSRAQVALDLARSAEWIGRRVDALYQSALGRPADAGGLRYWRHRVLAGMRIGSVGAHLYGSEELLARSGGTHETYVGALYREVLHREPDDGGAAHWVGRLRAGTDRVTVAAGFLGSIESRRDRVAATYRSVLGREPDGSGLDHWGERLATIDDVVLAASLAASDEYVARVG